MGFEIFPTREAEVEAMPPQASFLAIFPYLCVQVTIITWRGRSPGDNVCAGLSQADTEALGTLLPLVSQCPSLGAGVLSSRSLPAPGASFPRRPGRGPVPFHRLSVQ